MKRLDVLIKELEEKYPELKALRQRLAIERFSSDGWSALYIDGELVTVGDHYQADEVISEILDIKEEQNDDYFLGKEPQKRDVVAQTVSEIRAYQGEKEARLDRARDDYAKALELMKAAAAAGDTVAVRALKKLSS